MFFSVFLKIDSGSDSDDSDAEDTEITTLTEPTNNIIQKSASLKFEIPFNYCKDQEELILT